MRAAGHSEPCDLRQSACHECGLGAETEPESVTGPGGVQASFNWQAAKPSIGQMLTVALTNDVEDYA